MHSSGLPNSQSISSKTFIIGGARKGRGRSLDREEEDADEDVSFWFWGHNISYRSIMFPNFFSPRSRSLDALTGFAMGRRLNVLSATAFSFCRWWPWSSAEHRSNGAARPGAASSPINLFLTT